MPVTAISDPDLDRSIDSGTRCEEDADAGMIEWQAATSFLSHNFQACCIQYLSSLFFNMSDTFRGSRKDCPRYKDPSDHLCFSQSY